MNYFLIYWIAGMIGCSVELHAIISGKEEVPSDMMNRLYNLECIMGSTALKSSLVILGGLVYLPCKVIKFFKHL